MMNQAFTQSQKRYEESISALFLNVDLPFASEKSMIFIKSSSDQGVIRNNGRNGARLAPKSFLSAFKKLNQSDVTKKFQFKEFEVSSQSQEEQDFVVAQLQESAQIRRLIQQNEKAWLCHIGGGHDHIYPLLQAVAANYKKIVVLNIDAHADTRIDHEPHSGTPFRQFANETQAEFSMFQLGLHSFANSFSTLTPLKAKNYCVLWKHQLSNEDSHEAFFTKLHQTVDADTLVIFSLDADALQASEVPGVSAVNVDGISRSQLLQIWKKYRGLNFNHPPILGIYELNPVYDTLSMISAKTLASFCFEILE